MLASLSLEEAARQPAPPLHPLGGCDLDTFRLLCEENEPFSERTKAMRAACRAGIVVRLPFTFYERCRWEKQIRARTLAKDPVFILGHWRSGTTHLHNLMSQDLQFGWLSFYQANMPLNMLGKKVAIGRFVMKQSMPKTRGFDNVSIGLDTPQEDDLAMANLNPVSEFKTYYFPREAKRHFAESVFFEGLSTEAMQEFTDAYLFLLRKLDYFHQGRQLLMKNPASTGRIPFLLEHFPNAKFIHIVRNPFKVFASSGRRYVGALPSFSWQDFADFDIDGHVLEFYERLMSAYRRDRELIPDGNLIETRFEDLTSNPIDEIGRIYEQLELPGVEAALERVAGYLDANRDYQKNTYQISRGQVEAIRERWGFAFDEWGYPEKPNGFEIVD